MKKIITIILAIFVTFSFSACGNDINTYKYADDWSEDLTDLVEHIGDDSLPGMRECATEDERFNQMLVEVKEMISTSLSDREGFDWDQFEELQTIKIVDVNKIQDEKSKKAAKLCSAIYDREQNQILVMSDSSVLKSGRILTTLVHETIHSLLTSSHSNNLSRLSEGSVDYYTSVVEKEYDLDKDLSYPSEATTYLWLVRVYGEEAAIDAARKEQLETLIDNGSKPGMGERMNYSFAFVLDTMQRPEAYGDKRAGIVTYFANVELDILCHLAVNEGKSEDVADLLDWLEGFFTDNYQASIDTKYFKKLLKN